MVPTERAVLQFFIIILCTINGLHSYPRNHPSLGILNELIGTDSKSPLIVVVDSNNQAKTFNDEPERGYGQGQGQSHSKSYHDNSSPKMSNQEYETALYDLLRTSQKIMENQARQGPKVLENKDKCGDEVKNSCEQGKQEFLAEQCSQSVDSCGCFDDKKKETCS